MVTELGGMVAAALLLACTTAGAAGEQTIPWDLKQLATAPRTFDAPAYRDTGVRALFYEGPPFQGKQTRVFAWYAVPEHPAGTKVPGIVLVHGGGGTAFAEWVRLWASRGYAAIAMDLDGSVPAGAYGNWQRHEWAGPAGISAPGNSGFDQLDWPVTDQWCYHAVADVLLANSLLRSMPGVDPNRIGVTGISWGGFLTSIVAGVDPRFRFAVPVYGCGFLGEDSCWVGAFEQMGKEKAARWLSLWDPSRYLPRARMPMLWVTGTNDFAYPLDSLQRSYRAARGPHALAVRLRMPHGHGGPGENPEEIHAFADSLLRSGEPLVRVARQGRSAQRVTVEYRAARPIMKAELLYTSDPEADGGQRWEKREWHVASARFEAPGRVVADLPAEARVYFVNLADDRGLVVSTEHVEVPARK